MTSTVQVTVVAGGTVVPIKYEDVTRISRSDGVLTVVLERGPNHCFNLRHVVDWVIEENEVAGR